MSRLETDGPAPPRTQGQNRPHHKSPHSHLAHSAVALSSFFPTTPPHPRAAQIRSAKPKSEAEERNLERSCRRRPRQGGRGARAPQGSISLRSTSGSSSKRKMPSAFSGDETAPFFGFLGAAAALIFSCKYLPSPLAAALLYFLFRFLEFGWGKRLEHARPILLISDPFGVLKCLPPGALFVRFGTL